MDIVAVPSILSGLFCGGLAVLVFFRNPRSFVQQAFALGMISLGLREVGSAMALQASSSTHLIGWIKVSLAGEALLPGCWLLFSLSFARSNYKELLFKWRGLIVTFFGFPLFLAIFSWPQLLNMAAVPIEGPVSVVPLDRPGYYLKLFLLISFVLILIQLEGTFRASSGIKRWQIKFMILGTGGILAFGIYDAGQTLLYSAINLNTLPVRSMIVILADAVILFALIRHRLLDVDIFVSRYVLYNSVTLLASGLYLFLVGVTVFGIQHFGGGAYVPFIPVFVFLLLLGLLVFLLSDELKRKVKNFINSHFYKNKHDYRVKWQEFTQAVGSKLTMSDLSSSVVSWLSDTLGTTTAAIWIYNANRGSFELASQIGIPPAVSSWPANNQFSQFLRERASPVGSESFSPTPFPLSPVSSHPYTLFVPLFSGQEMLGFATLGTKITKDSYDFHDLELLKTVGDQIAGQIHRVRVTEELSRAKEMEAFQTVSTFFIHDLKNLASMLSLVMQNIPSNYDNPEFRKDAFRVMSESVGKMNAMCGNLSLITKKLDLRPVEIDLNKWVDTTLKGIEGSIQSSIVKEFLPLPKCFIDPDQFQKVLVNLVLNAKEAMNDQGKIHIATSQKNGWNILTVGDEGCGMAKEFIERSLFKPFQTTKSQGFGIGLFQCKKIVEAHQGRIEVESEVGKGSVFKVLLPIKEGTDIQF